MSNLFEDPDAEYDKTAMDEDAKRRGGDIDWSKKFWKPKPKMAATYSLRVLPARKDSGCVYHLRIGKHFINHADDPKAESFVCSLATYGHPCPACEYSGKLKAEGKLKESGRFSVKMHRVFNVIDRADEAAGVRLYEAPLIAVGLRILRMANDPQNENFVDEYNEKDILVRPGYDIKIEYDPSRPPAFMYVVYPGKRSPLGSAEQIKLWTENAPDLKLDTLYPEVHADIAHIKTFGTKAERDAMREVIRESRGEEKAAEKTPQKETPPPAAAAPAEQKVVTPVIPAKAAPPTEQKVVTPAAAKAAAPGGASSDTIARVRERIAAIRNKGKT